MNSEPFEIIEINPIRLQEQCEWHETEKLITELLTILEGDNE